MFLPIAFAILTVAAAACYLSMTLIQRQNFRDSRQELLTLANLIATEVDPVAHETLTTPEQMDTLAYHEVESKLGRSLAAIKDVKFIYTLRQVGSKYHFVVDPTPPGDHDGDGVDDKSYLMDPYDEITPTARSVFRTGQAAAEDEMTSDKWGTFLSAYAPIRSSSGELVAIVGVDRDQSSVIAEQQRLRQQLWIIFGSVSFVGIIFAFYLTGRFYREGRHKFFRVGSTKNYIRLAIFEMLLVGVTCCSLVTGLVWHNDNRIALKELEDANRKLIGINGLATNLEYWLKQPGTKFPVDRLRQDLRHLQLKKLAAIVDANALKLGTESADAHSLHLALKSGIEAERSYLRKLINTRGQEALDRAGTLVALFAVAAGCALVALVLIRYALRQQTALSDALAESDLSAARYQNVVESLPVGLFTFAEGRCDYSNREWDEQFGRAEDEFRNATILRSIHPDDRQKYEDLLKAAERDHTSFSTQFRIIRADQSIAHIESRGVPVFNSAGEFEHLLGFSIDITESVHSRDQLEEKSAIIESTNEQLQQMLDELNVNLEATVRALVIAVDAKDPYTAGHSERVMAYSVRIGHELGLSLHDLKVLSMGALIHDIGKIGVPDAILTKPHGLTDEEFRVIAEHPSIGYNMIQGIPLFAECAPIVRSHHERLDGTGYPDGLKGDEISLLVRIASVADAFDAITSTRAYRKGRSSEEALVLLREDVEKGRADGEVVEALARLLGQTDLKSQIYREAA